MIEPGFSFGCCSLVSGYDERRVLQGVTIEVRSGEVVAVIGHNGAGKSTLLKTLFGLLPTMEGEVKLNGVVLRTSPRRLLSAGVAYVPQGNRVFTELTVRENLELARIAARKQPKQRVDEVLCSFPKLGDRLQSLAGVLSGGEKQMLALATVLVYSPRVLLLDEPSLGLDPRSAEGVLERIWRLSRESTMGVLVVEQKVREILKKSDRVCVIRNGAVAYSGNSEDLKSEQRLRDVYL